MSLKNSETEQNLENAFAGESQRIVINNIQLINLNTTKDNEDTINYNPT